MPSTISDQNDGGKHRIGGKAAVWFIGASLVSLLTASTDLCGGGR